LLKDSSDSHTIFVKDRNDFSSAGANRHVLLCFVEGGLMKLRMAEDDDGSNTETVDGVTSIPGSFNGSVDTAAWSYLAYSVEMQNGNASEIKLFYNNA
jgi:hypothetical protein